MPEDKMINQNCDKCTFFTGRSSVDGKLQWGRFCVLLAYRDDLPVVEIHVGYICPLVNSINAENGTDKPIDLKNQVDTPGS